MEFKIMDFMTAFMFDERPQDCCEESIHFRVVDPFQDVARVSQNSRCYLAVDEAAFSPKACCALLIDSIVRYAFVLFHFRNGVRRVFHAIRSRETLVFFYVSLSLSLSLSVSLEIESGRLILECEILKVRRSGNAS